MGKIKKLHFDEINKWPEMGDEDLYPLTHTDAVFDDLGRSLTQILAALGDNGGNTTPENPEEITGNSNYTLIFRFASTTTASAPLLDVNYKGDIATISGSAWKTSNNAQTQGYSWMTCAKKSIDGDWLPWEDSISAVWMTPVCLGRFTSGSIIQGSASNTISFGAALYIATSKEVTSVDKPNYGTASISLLFDFDKGQVLLTNPVSNIGWDITPEKATVKYNKSPYILWVSYNNYMADFDNGNVITGSEQETGWSTPVKYLDIDGILKKASEEAEILANKALENANGDFESAKKDLEEAIKSINKAKEFLGEGYSSYINGQAGNLTLILALLAKKDDLEGYVTTSVYEQTADSIKLLVATEYALENETLIRTAVQELSSEIIRLQVSEAIDNTVVTTSKLLVELEGVRIAASLAAVDSIKDKLRTGEILVKPGNISLVVAEGNPNAATGSYEATSKAIFNISLKDGESKTNITSDLIILNGQTIADAIAAKYLNIDNYTYLFGKYGTSGAATQSLIADKMQDEAYNASASKYPIAWFGAGTSGMTAFNSDGSGYFAGGLVKWGKGIGVYNQGTNNFGVEFEGHISARSGWIGKKVNTDGTVALTGWEIGTVDQNGHSYAALVGRDDNNNYLALTTEFLEAIYNGDIIWQLLKDGSGKLAKGKLWWNNAGDLSVEGKIIATQLTLKGDTSGTVAMNFRTYDQSMGNPTNGTTVEVGEPVLFGLYNNTSYLIPLLKLGNSSLATYNTGSYTGYSVPVSFIISNYNGAYLNMFVSNSATSLSPRTLYHPTSVSHLVKDGNKIYPSNKSTLENQILRDYLSTSLNIFNDSYDLNEGSIESSFKNGYTGDTYRLEIIQLNNLFRNYVTSPSDTELWNTNLLYVVLKVSYTNGLPSSTETRLGKVYNNSFLLFYVISANDATNGYLAQAYQAALNGNSSTVANKLYEALYSANVKISLTWDMGETSGVAEAYSIKTIDYILKIVEELGGGEAFATSFNSSTILPFYSTGSSGSSGGSSSGTTTGNVKIIDTLNSSDSISALSANQGRILNEKIKSLQITSNSEDGKLTIKSTTDSNINFTTTQGITAENSLKIAGYKVVFTSVEPENKDENTIYFITE